MGRFLDMIRGSAPNSMESRELSAVAKEAKEGSNLEVQASGATICVEGFNLKVKPAGVLPLDLKDKLREHKTEILRRLELEASMRRLEAAGVCIAILESGEMRTVISEDDTVKAIDDGATIYSPEDMYHYVTLSEHERRMLHSFKKRFGGVTEWKVTS